MPTNGTPLAARRRAQLIGAATTLFSRKGYYLSTVKDIADEAGVSAGLIYQYVSDKQDLLFLVLLHIVQQNKEGIPRSLKGVKDPIARLYYAIDTYSRVIAANKKAVLLTYRESGSLKPEYITRMKSQEIETNHLIGACVEECIQVGYLAQTNVELLVYRIIIAAHAWALKNWRFREIVTFDEYLEQAVHAPWTELLLPAGISQYDKLLRAGKLKSSKVANKIHAD